MPRFRSTSATALLCALLLLAQAAPVNAAPAFAAVEGFATKTGFRGVVTWQTTAPIAATVVWGTSRSSLTNSAGSLTGGVDTAGMAILDGLPIGSTVFYRVKDTLSGLESPVKSFPATNAYTSFDDGVYTINLLVTLDSHSLPDGVPADAGLNDLAAGVNVLSERVYDALDGHARLGTVLITDTLLNDPVNLPHPNHGMEGLCRPETAVGPGNRADILVQTTVPFDSRSAYGDQGFGISLPCDSIYLGRLGNLSGGPWLDDLYLGHLTTHELMHYAFGAEDLYDVTGEAAGCDNPAYDISIMGTHGGYRSFAAGFGSDPPWGGMPRWFHTELDRTDVAICPAGTGGDISSWDRLRARYTHIPPSSVPEHIVDTAPRGNPDGGALRILTLHNTPLGSSLTRYVPSDPELEVPAEGRFVPGGSLSLAFAPDPARATSAVSPEGCSVEPGGPVGMLATGAGGSDCHSAAWGDATSYRDTDTVPGWPAAFTSAVFLEPVVLGGQSSITVYNADLARLLGPGSLEIVVEELTPDGTRVLDSGDAVEVLDGRNRGTFEMDPSIVAAGSRLRVRMRLYGLTTSAARMLFGGPLYGDSGITFTTGHLA